MRDRGRLATGTSHYICGHLICSYAFVVALNAVQRMLFETSTSVDVCVCLCLSHQPASGQTSHNVEWRTFLGT